MGDMHCQGSYDNTLKLWDIATGKEIRTFKGYSRGIYSMAISLMVDMHCLEVSRTSSKGFRMM